MCDGMNKEIYHEGWLVKSPPTKRIWRARWRRRWFTLKQGEIPGQFCLEYYTDHNCRKLKGVIDLDQCEQVDCGLRLEHRKQKFQNMFDIKTPHRTYYLAADSSDDMNDWVKCICQVCNLQDLTKQSATSHRQYSSQQSSNSNLVVQRSESFSLPSVSNIDDNRSSIKDNTYENDGFRNSSADYSNRDTILFEEERLDTTSLQSNDVNKRPLTTTKENGEKHLERSQSINNPPLNLSEIASKTQSFVDRRQTVSSSSTRKIPENLKLNDHSFDNNAEPSPALSSCSGPYIPISECFSGSPISMDIDTPTTPLNSLDPKFYDTPRNHINIGLNLTNEQPYSPKRNNCLVAQPRERSGRSSPTDSESVFTDDEDWTQPPSQGLLDRNLRPSDSSVENDSIVFTYTHRFSKRPEDKGLSCNIPKNFSNSFEKEQVVSTKRHDKATPPIRPPKRISGLVLDPVEDRQKENLSSDTENSSPAIGPKDNTSVVEESYDIPRSHQLPYYVQKMAISPTLSSKDISLISTDFENADNISMISSSAKVPRDHFYSNAAPSKVDNIFRYDFVTEDQEAPSVNRSLKPKLQSDVNSSLQQPPCIDRKLKPSISSTLETNTLRRKTESTLKADTDFYANHSDISSKTLPRNYNSKPVSKPAGQLEYFDLDHSNPPPICSTASASNLTNIHRNQRHLTLGGRSSKFDTEKMFRKTSIDNNRSMLGAGCSGSSSGVVYKSVDFIKTEAIKRTLEDKKEEMNRAQSKEKS